ncbi:MAG: hypothetical protein HY815_08195 [Candidatus Riflebacteria bacterium]|nr:hypothetical protein [Candidatus Riflebacteria bacterium]
MKAVRKMVLALGTFLAMITGGLAGEFELKSKVEPPGPYLVGDRLTVVWEMTHDPKVKIRTDLASAALKALQQAGFEPLGDAKECATLRTVPLPHKQVTVLSAAVTTYATGVHRIEPVSIEYADATNASRKAATPEMVVPVRSVLPATKAEPKPLKDPLPYPYSFSLPTWAWIVLGSLVALAIWLWRRRSAGVALPPPPVPPYEEALQRIEALLKEGLLAAGQTKEFCDRLSDILRHYLGRRFGLASMGETSLELLAALGSAGQVQESDLGRLTTFLDECDLVKFARHSPGDVQKLVDAARGLVESTRPLPPPAQATAAQGGGSR